MPNWLAAVLLIATTVVPIGVPVFHLATGREQRRALRLRSRLGPNPPDVPRATFTVQVSIGPPHFELRGGDPGELTISAHHLGLYSTGLFTDRVLVIERGPGVSVVLAGTRPVKDTLRVTAPAGTATVAFSRAVGRDVAHWLATCGWETYRAWS